MTSRRPEWDAALGVKTIQLTTLPRPASIQLLRRFRPDIPEIEPALDGIRNELGDLPLALHLAGSFLKTYRGSRFGQPDAYLESLQQKDLLNHPSLQGRGSTSLPTGHEGHVGRTFALSLERLDPTDETDVLAVDLLTRAAWFAPGEPIPRPLLLKTVHADSEYMEAALLAEDALLQLLNLGLIEVNDENNLLMHRLVAVWARSVASVDEAQETVEQAVLDGARWANETRNPAALLSWQPHLRTVTDRAVERNTREAARLCDELGSHLWLAGDYSEARRYLEKSVALHTQTLGAEDLDTARSLHNLGRVLHSQGDYLAARSCFGQGLAVREKVLGMEHQEVAMSLNDLGVVLNVQGDPVEARICHERALRIREKVLGAEHPDTAMSLHNLGSVLHDQGDYEGARSYCQRSLAILEKTSGSEHPDTATTLNNLGDILRSQGNYEEANSCLQLALSIMERTLGLEHPNTAANFSNLGGLLQGQGDYEGARFYLERALRICEKVLGPEHPDTARSLSSLGSILQDQEDYEGLVLIVSGLVDPREGSGCGAS